MSKIITTPAVSDLEMYQANLPQHIANLLSLKNDQDIINWLNSGTDEIRFGKPTLDPYCDSHYNQFPDQCELIISIHDDAAALLIDCIEKEVDGKRKFYTVLDMEVVMALMDNGIKLIVEAVENNAGDEPIMLTNYDLGDFVV